MWRRIADTARTATQSDIDSTLPETTPVIRVQDSGPFKVNHLFLTLSIEVSSSCSQQKQHNAMSKLYTNLQDSWIYSCRMKVLLLITFMCEST